MSDKLFDVFFTGSRTFTAGDPFQGVVLLKLKTYGWFNYKAYTRSKEQRECDEMVTKYWHFHFVIDMKVVENFKKMGATDLKL